MRRRKLKRRPRPRNLRPHTCLMWNWKIKKLIGLRIHREARQVGKKRWHKLKRSSSNRTWEKQRSRLVNRAGTLSKKLTTLTCPWNLALLTFNCELLTTHSGSRRVVKFETVVTITAPQSMITTYRFKPGSTDRNKCMNRRGKTISAYLRPCETTP